MDQEFESISDEFSYVGDMCKTIAKKVVDEEYLDACFKCGYLYRICEEFRRKYEAEPELDEEN